MVDKNVLKLETRRLRRLLYSKADEVLTLEQRKLQLTTAMQERHREIEVHKDMLLAQMKSANEERSQISAELHERISMIDKLRKRFAVVLVFLCVCPLCLASSVAVCFKCFLLGKNLIQIHPLNKMFKHVQPTWKIYVFKKIVNWSSAPFLIPQNLTDASFVQVSSIL